MAVQELIEKHQAALDRAPADEKPFRELENLFTGASRWDELLRLYEGRARLFPELPNSPHLLARAADLLRTRLNDPARAEELYRRALAARQDEPEALSGLKVVFEAKGDLGALAELLERRAARESGPDAASTLLELGEAYERLGRRERAVLAYQRAARQDPARREALERAYSCLWVMERYRLAHQVLETIRSRFGGEGLATRFAELAQRLADLPPLHPLALEAAKAALAIDPSNAQAKEAQELVKGYPDGWRERVKALRIRANDERDRKQRARLLLAVALAHASFDGEAESRRRSREFLDSALLLWPAMPQALDSLEWMAEQTRDFEGLDTFLEKLAAETKDRVAAVDLLLRLAALRVIRLDRREAALAALEKAVQLDPARAEAVGLAVDFLLDAGRAKDAASLLERHLDAQVDRRGKLSLHLRLAELLDGRLGDRASARAHLERALELDSTSPEIARRLVPIYEAEGEAHRLAAVLELALPPLGQPALRAAALERLAEIHADLLDQPADAARALGRALVLEPAREGLLQRLRACASAGEAWDVLASACLAAADLAPAERRRELLVEAARTLDEPLGRAEDALATWRRVLEAAPGDAEATAAIEGLLSRTGAHDDLVAQLEARLAVTEDKADRRALLDRIAAALEEKGGDPEKAAAAYRRMLELDPDDEGALKRLGAACAATERWEDVAEVTGRLASVVQTPEEAREWRARRAQVLADRLGRKEEAAEILLALLGEEPSRPGLVASLERIASSGVQARRIAEALLPIHRRAGDHVRAAASLQALITGTDEPGRKAALMRELAEVYEGQLADRRAAFGWLEQAFRLDPADEAREELERLAGELPAQAELAATLMEVADKAAEPRNAFALLMRSARLAEQAADYDLAFQALDLAQSVDGDGAEALRALSRVAARAERWPVAEKALRQRLDGAGENRGELLAELAAACERQGKPGEAARALEDALSAGAAPAELLPRLVKLYEAAGDKQGLRSALGRELQVADAAGEKDRAARLRMRLNRLMDTGDRSQAAASWAAVLAERPTDPEALAALEKMLQDAETREAAARALVPAYEASKEFRKLVWALEIQSEGEPDPAQRAALLRRAAQIHALDLRQPELAFTTLARALRLAPGDAQLRVAARKAAEDCGELDTYVELLSEAAEAFRGALAVPLLRELAEMAERKQGDREKAAEHLRRVLEIDPENVDALRGLHRLARLDERWEQLAETCQRLARVVSDDHERVALFREAGTLFEGALERPEDAAACFRALSEIDPLDRDAALALERLNEALKRPADLAYALELRRAQEGASAAGREAAFRLAELKRGALNDPAGALQIYGQILTDDPTHASTRAALEAWAKGGGAGSLDALRLVDPVLQRSAEHARRVAMREARLSGAGAEEKAALWAEIREIYERDLGRGELAFMAACRAFAEGVDRERTGPEAERLAKETNSWEELAELYEQVAESSTDGDEAGTRALRRAAQLRSQLGEAERAVALFKDLLAEVPGDREALQELARLHERTQNALELAEVYKAQAAQTDDAAKRAGLLIQSGQARLQLGQDEAAAEMGRAALALTPKSRPALELLERAYERLGRGRERADALRLLAEVADDPQARRRFLVERASLLEREGEGAEAVDAFAKVLSEAPGEAQAVAGLERLFQKDATRSPAARVLEEFYRSVDEPRRLCEVLEVKASQASREERVTILRELAGLREALGQRPLAFAALLRCFHDDPRADRVRDDLERLAAEAGAFEELAAAYEDCLEAERDEALRVELWRRLGVIWGERLARPDKAAQALEEVAARAPGDAEVLGALARLYRRTNSVRELSTVLTRQVKLAAEPARKRELLLEVAELAETRLGDLGQAVAAWKQALELDETDTQAQAALQELLAETGRFEELASLFEARVALAERQGRAEEALALKVELGKVRLTRLSDPRAALALFTEVLSARPGHPAAVDALGEMARGAGPLHAEAALALEPVFAGAGDNLRLVQVLEARAQGASPVERAALLRRIAGIYAGPLASPDMAFVYASRALEAAPEDPESLDACLSYAREADTEQDLAGVLPDLVERASDELSRARLQRAMARLLSAGGDEPAEAVEAWRKLLELSPGDGEAQESLSRLLREQARWPELLEVLRRRLGACEDPDARVALLREIAEVQDERTEDPAGAIATLRRLLETLPADLPALSRLDALCLRTERWAELADVLTREIALAGQGADELELKLRLAQVREERLLDRPAALELLREVQRVRPGHPEVVARLEAMVARSPEQQGPAELLADAYRATSNHAKLARLLEDRASVLPDGGSRKKLLQELARVRAQSLDRPDLAFLALHKAFREDPSDAELRRTLERVAEQADVADELAALYEDELPRLSGPDAGEVSIRLAQMHEKAGDAARAVEFYERARAFDPARSPQCLAALDRLYKAAEKWDELAEVLEALVAQAAEPAEKVSLLFRLGQLAQDKLDPPSPDRAARAFEQILELDPTHLPAARSLEKLYEAARRFDRLFSVLELQRARATGPERERLTVRMAEVASIGLEDEEKAVALYGEALALNPRSEAAFEALEGLHEKSGRTDALVELLERRLALTVDPREITRLSDKVGRLLAGQGRNDEAIAAFRAALERDPRHGPALRALRDIYEKYAPGEELAGVIRRLIPLEDDPAGVKKLRLRLAEVLSALGRKDEAIEAGRRALDVEPHAVEDLARAEELFRGLSAHVEQIRAMELRAEVLAEADQPAQAVAALYAVCELFAGRLGKRDSAAPTYERILEIAPGERPAFDALKAIYSAQGDWRRYASVCDRYLGAAPRAERLEVLKDLGSVHEVKLGHKDLAFLSYCRAFDEDPADEQVRAAAERLAGETGSWDELATVYEELVEGLEPSPLAERLWLSLARIQDEKLDDAEAAEASLRKALDIDPASHGALESLAAMFARRGRDADYVVSLEQKLEAAASIEERKAILLEIARTFEERLHKQDEAAEALKRALDLEPDRETYRTLVDLFRRQKKHSEAVDALVRARDLEREPSARAVLQVEVAEIYERDLSDDEAAVAGYQQALEFDPANREALTALERLYTKLDRGAELLGVYEAQLKVADARERVKVQFKAAGVWESKFQNLENADACIEAVLAVDPGNLQAVKQLERLRRLDAEARQSPARWEDLLRAYERHLSLKPEAAEQVQLLVAMGEVNHRELKRIDKAAQLFQQALDLDPRSREAMHGLGVLYERSGNWPFALEMLSEEAELLGATKDAVELYHRIGKINEEMLQDNPAARQAYGRALELDPGYLPSLRSLKGICEQDKDWDRFLALLVQEAEHTQEIEDRALAWLAVAQFHQDSREDRDQAARYFEEALKLAPELLDAARPLSDIYVAREDWERAEQMLEVVTRKLAEGARDAAANSDLCRQLYRLGYVCDKLKKSDRALSAYEKAYQLDATYLPAAEGYGNLLVAAGRHADALAAFQAILINHREDLTDLEVVEYYWQVGDLFRKLGQPERAQKEFGNALSIDANHEPSLRAQVQLCEERGDAPGAYEHMQRLVELVEEGQRAELYLAMGRLAQHKLQDPYRAVEAYTQALRLRGDDVPTLEALLSLYRETRQGQKAVEILERLLALVKEPAQAKKLYLALGETLRDEAKDLAKAAEAFNKALDLDYRFVQAFEALESMLGGARQWEALEQDYLRMIHRLPKVPETHAARMTLFRALGDFYEKVRRDKKAARQVFQVVARGLPDDVRALEKYAELCGEEEGAEREAIEAWRAVLPLSEQPQKAIHQVARLSAKAKDYDGAFVAAQAAAFLVGEQGTDEREILTKLTPYAKKKDAAQKSLTDTLWGTQLYHPKVRGPMGDMLALVYRKLGSLLAKRPSAFGLDAKHRIDLQTSQELALNTYRQVLRVLDLEALDLYSPFLAETRLRMKQRGAQHPEPPPDRDLFLEILHTHPVSLRAGGKLFSEQSQKELVFFLAKAMTWSRPELALARVLPAERLDALFQAAVVTGVPNYRVTAEPRTVQADRLLLERLEPQFKAALAQLARDYARTAGAPDVREFIEGAELTANRAGALLCGDLEAAKAALAKDPLAKLPLRARLRDLLLFSVSREFLELRGAIGLKIEVRLPGAR